MVDVQVWVVGEGGHDEVDEVLEGVLLLGAVAAPEGAEHGLAVIDARDTEEVLQAVLVERVALHVEEQIAAAGLGQQCEPATVLGL